MTSTQVGSVASVWRYPVKSMAGERLTSAEVTLQGIVADRMYAFVQAGSRSTFPWLTGRELPSLLAHEPILEPGEGGRPSLFVRSPSGERFEIGSDELRDRLARASGREVYLLPNYRGSFDVAALTFMATATVEGIAAASGTAPEPGRFRMNFYLETVDRTPFVEDRWVGKVLRVGERVRVAVTERDRRCVMITLAPHGTEPAPPVLSAVARQNDSYAGIYGSVLTPGMVSEGDPVFLDS